MTNDILIVVSVCTDNVLLKVTTAKHVKDERLKNTTLINQFDNVNNLLYNSHHEWEFGSDVAVLLVGRHMFLGRLNLVHSSVNNSTCMGK
jgi:hypothetical protein